MANTSKIIPIYTSNGDLGGFLRYPYLYNRYGEWIGWVTAGRKVYSVNGHLVGEMTTEPRIIRKREVGAKHTTRELPPIPDPIRPPAHVPLAPQMAELAQSMIDVLEEAPDLLPPIGFGERQEDLD